ncbi:hypothetical protein RRG08_059109 [Elysia crispata]|uniref:Uncharacterized protein n=1 Tax=Elysia crispata TaxID=231223 RepID=A0AAE1AXD4_9GAST|nr:hypothetical protein RRG08_059109 [Elysia crispata]
MLTRSSKVTRTDGFTSDTMSSQALWAVSPFIRALALRGSNHPVIIAGRRHYLNGGVTSHNTDCFLPG